VHKDFSALFSKLDRWSLEQISPIKIKKIWQLPFYVKNKSNSNLEIAKGPNLIFTIPWQNKSNDIEKRLTLRLSEITALASRPWISVSDPKRLFADTDPTLKGIPDPYPTLQVFPHLIPDPGLNLTFLQGQINFVFLRLFLGIYSFLLWHHTGCALIYGGPPFSSSLLLSEGTPRVPRLGI